MNKQTVIDALERMKGGTKGVVAATISDCQRVISAMDDDSGWITAYEPPKNSDHVLVCTKHRKPFKARYFPERNRWDVSGSVVITHWMPLPEPPKEDKNAEMQ